MNISWTAVIVGLGLLVTVYVVLRLKSKQSQPLSTQFVYVNADGSVRELHPTEQEYLDTPFHGADGNRPYLKDSYSAKDGWGGLAGFIKRSKLPPGCAIAPAPAQEPPTSKPLSSAAQIQFLREKGIEVTENPDGSYVIPTQTPEVIADLRSKKRTDA